MQTILPCFGMNTGAGLAFPHTLCLAMAMQVRGRKRLLLYRPQALKALQPYPTWHILRRRCRVNPENPDYKRFPAFQKVWLHVREGFSIDLTAARILLPEKWLLNFRISS